MTRRGHLEGSIRHRSDGRWEARYRVSGGRQRSVYAKTRKGAQDQLRSALAAVEGGVRPVSGRLTTSAYLDEWLESSVRPRLRPTTAESYAFVVEQYLKPSLGRVPLAKLAPEHVQSMLRYLASPERSRLLSSTTVRYAHTVLRAALGRALKAGYVGRNVATLVDPPAKARIERQPLSATQVGVLLAATKGDRLAAMWATAVGMGLRQGELLALRWSDVDLEGDLLTVRHTLQRGTGALAEPKTQRGRRTLVVPAFVSASLREHRRRQLGERVAAGPSWHDLELVFATRTGRALNPRLVTKEFHEAVSRSGLPRQRFHDLRHACATLLIEHGEELAVVSQILGHSNLSTTADVYAHLTRGMQARAARRMDELLTISEAS